MSNEYRRPIFDQALARVTEPRKRIQVVAGPRQVGKTTLVTQLLEAAELPNHYASADDPALRDRAWLEAQWEIGRQRARTRGGALLALDEIQKISDWSETVKRLWDEDTRKRVPLRVIILGSAPLLVARGLSETLGGRFELIRLSHWSLREMSAAFGVSLDEYLFFGGYPGAADLIGDPSRWSSYILESIVETTISRDVLLLTRIDKPALLRSLFRLACDYSGQIVSYTKLLGRLQDAGNTTTLAHYLDLLGTAGMVTGLEKFSGSKVRQRRSSPKLIALNTALMSATSGYSFDEARADGSYWGRLVETAVGAHLLNETEPPVEISYWRDRNREVDFVAQRGSALTAFEVKSGSRRDSLPGLQAFADKYSRVRTQIVGADGIPVEEFLSFPASEWIS